jgi:hypothetical protein
VTLPSALIPWDLIEQVRQHGCVPDPVSGDLDCPYLKRFLVDPYMYLAPKAAFGTTMLARVPLITRQGYA